MCDRVFSNHFITNFQRYVPVKILKIAQYLVKIRTRLRLAFWDHTAFSFVGGNVEAFTSWLSSHATTDKVPTLWLEVYRESSTVCCRYAACSCGGRSVGKRSYCLFLQLQSHAAEFVCRCYWKRSSRCFYVIFTSDRQSCTAGELRVVSF